MSHLNWRTDGVPPCLVPTEGVPTKIGRDIAAQKVLQVSLAVSTRRELFYVEGKRGTRTTMLQVTMMNESNDDKGIVEEAKEALTVDADVQVDKKVPGATFSLVGLSYLVILGLGALLLTGVLWFYRATTETETDSPAKAPAGMVWITTTLHNSFR